MVTILSKFTFPKIRFKMPVIRLRWLISLSYIFMSIFPILFFYSTATNSIQKYFLAERQTELLRQANTVSGIIYESDFMTDKNKRAMFELDMTTLSKDRDVRIIVVDTTGIVVIDTNQKETGKTYLVPEVVEALEGNDSKSVRNDLVSAAVKIVNSGKETIGVVVLTQSISDSYTIRVRNITSELYTLVIFTIVIVLALAFLISQTVVDPLKNVVQIIQKMSDGHLDERIDVTSKNELGEIADAFNTMAEKLEKVDAYRQEFVSNVSHELKTPLSSIKVLSESILFQNDVPESMYKEFLEDINSEVNRMTDIINDLLTLVKFDQKEVPLIFQPISINRLISDIVKRLTPLAEQKNITLSTDMAKEITIDADITKITLALSNLMENAIKYTLSDGVVKITLSSDHQNVFISVADSGVGIAEAELGKIFDRFYRVDKTRDRETGGTGLGLAITQKSILLHKGSIKVTSKENEGSVFTVRIPLHQIS